MNSIPRIIDRTAARVDCRNGGASCRHGMPGPAAASPSWGGVRLVLVHALRAYGMVVSTLAVDRHGP